MSLLAARCIGGMQNGFLMPSLPTLHVFVYGTLRKGEQRDINRLRPVPRWLGQASVDGVLYDLGEYPGLVLAREPGSGQNRVKGDVYEIASALEPLLDEIEGLAPQPNGEYAKRQARVHLEPFLPEKGNELASPLTCLVYEVTPERVAGCPVIEGADWISFRLAREATKDS
jgi:gamma-glutamylcyclotransferase (GGCT)/AIG2-like uncharacterized protein YtfP